MSKSSRIRSSTMSGNLRVTITSGFFVFAIACNTALGRYRRESAVQPSLTVVADTAVPGEIRSFSYQMALTRQSFRATLGACARRQHRGIAAPSCPVGGRVATGSVSGLPVPRFVSLKSDRVNVRAGPNKDQDVRWVYTHAGMPVEITAEFENWRRIRDWEGAEGWVYHSLLSGKRTAVVLPTKNELVPLYEIPTRVAVTARLQSGVLGALKSCKQYAN